LEIISEVPISDTEILLSYKCGHSDILIKELPKQLDFRAADSSKSFVARKYQEEGVDFIVNGFENNPGFNCVIADQMRLGKTPQSLLALKNAYAKRTPCLIIVRGANLWQWVREYKVWTDTLPFGIYPIIGSKSFIPPGFSAYIISMDTLSRNGMIGKLLDFNFKLAIVDEAHSFKNTDSKRSQALVQFLQEISKEEITHTIPFICAICKFQWDEEVTINVNDNHSTVRKEAYCPNCNAYNVHVAHKEKIKENLQRKCGVILLTGTAIKNRADEYFIPLNIVAPEKFPSLARFRRDWLDQDQNGKWTRVKNHRYDEFKKTIRPYVLRREKEDVYTDLPPLNRIFTVIEIEDENLKKAYNKILDKLEHQLEKRSNFTFFDSIGDLMMLRQICGMAKVNWAADYLEASMLDSDTAKYAVGIHHHSVRDALAYKLAHLGVLKLSGEDNAERKDRIMTMFEKSPERVLVINMLAGGVGMDFHYCNNVLILERQWSSADEEQFEFRFYNPDKSIMGNRSTNIEYILAKGTIDEWFYDMVEEKRIIFGETIGNNWNIETDPTSFRQLIEQTVGNRL
jgi:SNF2 family DNA or RNA helicase